MPVLLFQGKAFLKEDELKLKKKKYFNFFPVVKAACDSSDFFNFVKVAVYLQAKKS